MIRVFVGVDPNGCDLESQAVLEYTLRKYASQPVELTWMQLSRDPTSPFYSDGVLGWRTELWSTPFSGFRWAVPELCGFKGRAIYCDSDIIFRADIAELWEQEFKPGKVVLAKGGRDAWRFCVSLWDCDAAASYVPHIPRLQSRPQAHREMVARFKGAGFVQKFEGNWNCIDLENYADINDPDIKVIHYSAEDSQPQLKHAIPRLAALGRKHWFDGRVKTHWRPELQVLFDELLIEAEAAGYRRENYMPPERFGEFKKQSHARGYRSHRFAPSNA